MKWVFYVIVFIYMCYRAVYGTKFDPSLSVEEIKYGDEGFLEVGTRKTVNCKGSNKNQKLEWIDPFGNVVKRVPSSRVFAQEHFVSIPKRGRAPALVLNFSELLVSDSGVYQCKSGEMEKNVSLCVIKPSEFVRTPSEVISEMGRSITLTCSATGDPEPRLAWVRAGEELTEGIEHPKYRVNTKYNSQGYESLLTIFSLMPEDGDLYTCVSLQESPMLDNCSHYEHMNVTLLVNHAPVFKNGNETKLVYGRNNQVVDLKCAASGWPKPTYRWFKDLGGDTLYEFDKSKITFPEDMQAAILSVTAGPTTFGQSYKCKASNSFGDTDKNFKLMKIEKPRKASEIETVNSSGNTIELNVTWYDETLFPVESFDIQYIECSDVGSKRPKESHWRKANLVKQEADEDIFDEFPGTVVKLGDLKPETDYFIRLRPVNEMGEAPWSDIARASTTIETEEETEAPEEEPLVAQGTGTFYGLFFIGAIGITVVVSVFVMRLV